MKHRGNKVDYEQDRKNDLMSVFHRLIDEADFISMDDIYKKVVLEPSARFWVSEERAAIVLSKMLKGDDLHYMTANKRAMFQEIYRRAVELRRKNPELSLVEVATRVVHQPAPCFYLEPKTARVYIFSVKRKWYEERKRRLRHLFM